MHRVTMIGLLALGGLMGFSIGGCGGGAEPSREHVLAARESAADVGTDVEWFREVTAEAGISTGLHPGFGHAWGDIDGDGLPDVWIVNHMYRPTIYRNNGDGTFTDVTASAWSGNLADFHGGAWADFDNDGDQDFSVLAGGDGGTKCFDKPFYVNTLGSMQDEAGLRNLNDRCGRGRTPLWLDWNNDGRLDLFIINEKRSADDLSPSRMMLQQPDGSFAELAELQSQSTAFGAQLLVLDGRLHMLVHSNNAYPAAFHEVGNPTPLPFQVQGPAAATPSWRVHDVAVGDFDGDLQDDLFMVQTQPPGKAYRIRSDGQTVDVIVKGLNVERGVVIDAPNIGAGTFRFWSTNWYTGDIRVGAAATTPKVKRTKGPYLGESLVWGELTVDFRDPALEGIPPPEQRTGRGIYIGRDPDGRIRIYGNGTSGDRLQFELIADQGPILGVQPVGFTFKTSLAMLPNFLFFADGEFHERRQTWGMDKRLSCGSVVAGDFDNDMDLDLFMACTGPIGHVANRLFENQGGTFVEVPDAGGGAALWSQEPGGVASVADYDQDGYLDVLVAEGCTVCGAPLRFGHRILLKNVRTGHHWIQFDLVGCQSNRDGIGARLVVDAGGRQQMRLAAGGMRHSAQDHKRIHFGLAENVRIDRLSVTWPSGVVTELDGLDADRIYTIREDAACERPSDANRRPSAALQPGSGTSPRLRSSGSTTGARPRKAA